MKGVIAIMKINVGMIKRLNLSPTNPSEALSVVASCDKIAGYHEQKAQEVSLGKRLVEGEPNCG